MKKFYTIIIIMISIVVYFYYYKNEREAEMANQERPIVSIETHVLDTMQNYVDKYAPDSSRLKRRVSDLSDNLWYPMEARASDKYNDPYGGFIMNYRNDTCPFTLPAGRMIDTPYIGGIVSGINYTFPLETLSWDEMQQEKDLAIDILDKAGWKRSRGYFTKNQPFKGVVTPEDFASFPPNAPKWVNVGFWEQCDNPFIKARLEVKHYNSSSPGSFVPTSPHAEPLDPLAEDRFLLRVDISIEPNSPIQKELELLRDSRREAINGDRRKEIPLSVWLDDPDWRPEGWDGRHIK